MTHTIHIDDGTPEGFDITVGPDGHVTEKEIGRLKATMKRWRAFNFPVPEKLWAEFTRAIRDVKEVLGGEIVDPVDDVLARMRRRYHQR